MPIFTALTYWAVVIVWLCVLAITIVLYRRNRHALGTARLLLVVVAIDTIRNVIENSYFGAYFGGKYGLLPEGVTVILGNPYLLILPKIANIIAGGIVLGVLLLRWLPHAIEERTNAEGRADYFRDLATRDGMTGLWNRREFVTLAEAETRRAARYPSPVSLLMFDIDNFKSVNDRFGHDVGDRVIVNIARVCEAEIRASDIVGRLGGEEFAVLLPETALTAAMIFAERLRAAVAASAICLGDHELRTTVSIGVSEKTGNDLSVAELLKRADLALYQSKRSGRNCVSAFCASELDTSVVPVPAQ
jgi:diguanylate cyclase (GGDEF)-like protein